jgi:hypothetical protein
LLENYLNSISSSTLPLKLLSFNAAVSGKEVITSWSTANEINTSHFVVEKSSDGRSFSPTGTVAASNTRQTQNYSFVDRHPFDDASYYRLKLVDKDGSFTYSSVITINRKKASALLSVSPNPAVGNVLVSHPSSTTTASLRIFDAEGKILRTITIAPASAQTQLNLASLSSGSYLLVYESNNEKTTSAFIKK